MISDPIHGLMQWRPIPFYIHNTHEASDKMLQQYAMGRSVLLAQDYSTPTDSKIILDVVKNHHSNQISVHTQHLVPWEPVVGGEVIIIKGPFLGSIGVAREKKHNK